jgi:hypothetical protein
MQVLNCHTEVLYFLHTVTAFPKRFWPFHYGSGSKGNEAGCFRWNLITRTCFEFSQWFTRINHISCRGGDQSLFVTKTLFNEIKALTKTIYLWRQRDHFRLYIKNSLSWLLKIWLLRRNIGKMAFRFTIPFAFIHLKRRLGHSAESMLNYYNKE